MSTQTYTGTLYVTSCGECGTVFGMESGLQEKLVETGRAFYCPNGHCRAYRDSDVVRERKAREAAEKQAQWAREDAARQRKLRETAERSARAHAAHFRRIKNRVAHGVCPCCNRTFSNVARHMSAKHPEWKQESR